MLAAPCLFLATNPSTAQIARAPTSTPNAPSRPHRPRRLLTRHVRCAPSTSPSATVTNRAVRQPLARRLNPSYAADLVQALMAAITTLIPSTCAKSTRMTSMPSSRPPWSLIATSSRACAAFTIFWWPCATFQTLSSFGRRTTKSTPSWLRWASIAA
ncbi:hypothetical protein IWX90DRAFT_430480 [Phyllosticta citrichinensis]|uniref:Uncharacterized protein n=1 Tax=Phyllosticta citrichinensis TaxID=1130410 RepID=A0ABR1XW33_9PEZI